VFLCLSAFVANLWWGGLGFKQQKYILLICVHLRPIILGLGGFWIDKITFFIIITTMKLAERFREASCCLYKNRILCAIYALSFYAEDNAKPHNKLSHPC
jgi:hypothetical protein